MSRRRCDFLLLSGTAVLPVAVSAYATALILDPDHDFIAETVSKLAVPGRPRAAAIGIGLVAVGILIVVFAHGLRRAFGDTRWSRLSHAAFTLTGLLMIVGVFLPDDPAGAVTRTGQGWAHDIIFFGVVASAVPAAAATSIAARQRGEPSIARATVAVAVVLLITEIVLRGGTGFADGLLERLAAFGFVCWVSFVAWRLHWSPAAGRTDRSSPIGRLS
jgi:hypothetical protein